LEREKLLPLSAEDRLWEHCSFRNRTLCREQQLKRILKNNPLGTGYCGTENSGTWQRRQIIQKKDIKQQQSRNQTLKDNNSGTGHCRKTNQEQDIAKQ
jgi:hypothetical protein